MNTPSKESGSRPLNWVDYVDAIRRGAWPPVESDRRLKSRVNSGSTIPPGKEKPKSAQDEAGG